MTAQQLKNSILQMAVQGKLVPQDPGDEPASVLLERIKAEKQELIKTGKIKKDKKSSEIFRGASRNLPYAFCEQIGKEIRDISDEIPFEIPDSWEWCRLKNIVSLLGDGIHGTPEYSETGKYFFINGNNLSEGNIIIKDDTKKVDESQYLKCRKELNDNTVFVSINGTIGNIAFYNNEPVILGKSACYFNLIIKEFKAYMYWLLKTDYFLKYAITNATGSTIKNVSLKTMNDFLVPLPPLEEQKRIVAKIDELLPYIERYGKAEEHLTVLNTKFPEALKKSILQEAVQGKLVPQNPDDEPASVLLERIKAEKQKLIKEGKIKKEKPLAPITEEEIPFDIPESWEWCRVGEIFSHNTGKAMNSSAKKTDKSGDIRKFITTSNVYWNRIDFNNVKEMFFSDDELARCTVTKGDMVMCEGGAYYGRTAIWNYDYDICFQNHVHRLRAYKELCTLFYYYTFYFYRNNGMMESKGTAMPGLSSVILHNILIPLPPLEEQKRIVAKIEELMPFIGNLTK